MPDEHSKHTRTGPRHDSSTRSGLLAREDRGETVLTGRLPDQAALHGVLAQIEALGLELIEIKRR